MIKVQTRQWNGIDPAVQSNVCSHSSSHQRQLLPMKIREVQMNRIDRNEYYSLFVKDEDAFVSFRIMPSRIGTC